MCVEYTVVYYILYLHYSKHTKRPSLLRRTGVGEREALGSLEFYLVVPGGARTKILEGEREREENGA